MIAGRCADGQRACTALRTLLLRRLSIPGGTFADVLDLCTALRVLAPVRAFVDAYSNA
jgi:hypothetical protein